MHSGDWIDAQVVPQLLHEARKLQGSTKDSLILQFANDLTELAEASMAAGNPIVF
jgi:hypothetical protein